MKEIVIIASHADSEEKISTLIDCIKEIKKQGFDVILSSHIPVPDSVVTSIDYFVYDVVNIPIVLGEDNFDKSYSFYFTDGNYYQSAQSKKYHSYSILRLYTNALSLAWSNGYSIGHFVNYDYLIKDPNLLKKHSSILDSCDIFGYHDISFDPNMQSLDCGIFSVRIEKFLNCAKNIKSKNDFLIENEPVLENFIHKYFVHKCGLSIKSEDRSVLVNSDNILDVHRTDRNIINGEVIIYLVKEENLPNYFISVYTTTSRIYIIEICIEKEKRKYTIKPNYSVNLIDVTEFINSGEDVKIKINDLDFSDTYSIKTDTATCTFVNKDNVVKYRDLEKTDNNEVSEVEKGDVVIILCHVNTPYKEKVLDECIDEIKKQGYPIIITSHIEVPSKYHDIVDFIVYDRNNEFIDYSEFNGQAHIEWYRNSFYYEEIPNISSYSYPYLTLIKNGIGVAHVNGYSKSHVINYDYIIKDPSIFINHSRRLDKCDMFSYYYLPFDPTKRHVEAAIFSVNTLKFLKYSNKIKSKKEFIKIKQSHAEKFLYEFFVEKHGFIYEAENREDIEPYNKINVISSSTGYIKDKFFIYLVSEASTGRYFISLRNMYDHSIEIFIQDNYSFNVPGYGNQSLIDITRQIISRDSVEVKIPSLEFYDIYNINSKKIGSCVISDNSIVTNIEDFFPPL